VNGLQQTLTLAWRGLVQVRRNPWELGDYSIQPILFLVLFLYVFGGAIAGSPDDYLEFVLPGVIVMNMLFVTVYVGHGLNTDLTRAYLTGSAPCPSRARPRWPAGFSRMWSSKRSASLCCWPWVTCSAFAWRRPSRTCSA
jgi:oleandomycin transport system permease protein